MVLIDFHTHRKTAEGVVTPRSFGIHPWRADEENAETFEAFRKTYGKEFDEAEIIGECGLDKVCACDWQTQMRLFDWQIRIADELRKPLVIHCVHAFNEMLELRKGHTGRNWVVHGFTGSAQLATQLFRAGIWVSYGAALLDPKRQKVRNSLRENPHPFLLETDESDAGIEAVYRAASETLGIDIERLLDTIKQNYIALFGQ